MWELFGVIFATLGFIFELQEGFGLPSGALKGVFVLFSDFGCNLGVHVGPLLASILGCFLEAPNPENMHGASTGARFSQNRRFRKSSEKTSILESFSEAKTMKNREKMVLKTMCFFDIDFSSHFSGFFRFRLDFGRPRGSKN